MPPMWLRVRKISTIDCNLTKLRELREPSKNF
jgi:hypothetical protein